MMVSQASRYMHLPFYETCFLFQLFAPTVNQEYSLDRKCKTILKVNLRRNRCVPYSLEDITDIFQLQMIFEPAKDYHPLHNHNNNNVDQRPMIVENPDFIALYGNMICRNS